MTDWRDELGTLLGEITPDPVEPLLRGAGGLALNALESGPVQAAFRVLSFPSDVAKFGTGALIGGINRGLGALPGQPGYEPGTEAAFSAGGPRAAWEEVRADEPAWFQFPTEIGIDPLTRAGVGAGFAPRIGALEEAANLSVGAGRPGVAALQRGAALPLRGIQAFNDAPGLALHNELRLPTSLGGGEASLQGAVRGVRGGISRVIPSAFEESARSHRLNLQENLVDIASAKAGPLSGTVIGPSDYPVQMPLPFRRTTEDLLPPLRSQLDELGLTDVGLKLVRNLREVNPAAGPQDQALYRGREKLIAISLETSRTDEFPRLIDHEAMHALSDLGLFQGDEFPTLVRAADDMGLRSQVIDLYPGASGDRLDDEMVSALYSAYRSGVSVPEQSRSILQRVGDFLRRFGRAAPQVTPRDVLRRIDSGEIGARARAPRDVEGDLFSKRPPDPAAQRIRTNLEDDGVRLADRDPSFFPRFRSLVEGKNPQEVVQTLSTPSVRPEAPPLRSLDPDWDRRSQDRLHNAIAWASRPKSEGGYGPGPVQTALRNAPDLAPPTANLYDLMLRMPIGHMLWYDLSGLAIDEIEGMNPDQARKYVQYIAGTSPGETPFTNLKLGTAVMSEDLRGRPGWVGMRNTSQVERVAQGVGLGGPKTDDFALEIGQRSRKLRDPDQGALPVIDLWQARAYHLPDAQVVGSSDPLFAIIARHTIEDADELQRVMGPHLESFAGAPLTIEPRMVQAGLWVLGRENEGLYGKALAIPDFTRGSDYWSAMRQMESGLNASLPSVAATGARLTMRDLMDPDIANELTNYGIFNYEEGRHILTEFATSNTLPGVRTQETLLNIDQLAPDHPVRGQILNGFTPTAAEVRAGAPRTVPGVYQITRGMFKEAAESGVFDEMASALMRIPRGAMDLGRINYRAYGSWGDVLSPHLDLPTMGRVGGELVVFPQEVIERMMMGIAQAWRQDMAATNAWSTIGVPPEAVNSRIIYLPGVHFDEQLGGSIKAMPDELVRAGQVTRASGWPTQVVSSPLMSLIKLIDPRQANAPLLGDEELYTAMDEAGYTGQVRLVDAVHTSITADADPEVGYAALIADPGLSRNRAGGVTDNIVTGQSGTYPARPVGGSVPGSDWGGEPRQRFRDAVTDLRRRADTATDRLASAEPWYRRRAAATLGKDDLPWKIDPALAQRRIDLTATGGTAPNFPIGEDAFARVAAKALGVPPDHPLAHDFASLDPRLTNEQNALLRGNSLKDGRSWEQALEDEVASIREDLAKVRASGVKWGSSATPQQRLDAAAGFPEVGKIIRKYNKSGIDLMAANIDNPYHLASYRLGEIIDKDLGREFSRRTNYDLFRAFWGEQALFSLKYHTGNLTGGLIQNAIAGVYTGPVRTASEVLAAFKVLRGGREGVSTKEARESMLSWSVAAKYGFEPPSSLMKGGPRSMAGGVDRAGSSAVGDVVERITRSERAGQVVGAPFAASNDLGTAINTAVREPVWIQTFTDEMDERMVTWAALVRDRLRAAGVEGANDFSVDDLPSLDPGLMKPALIEKGLTPGVAQHLTGTFVEARGLANKAALKELDRVQFYGSRTNLDEWVGKVIPFHYWFSRALRYYGEAAIQNPALGLSYMRAADGVEDAQNDPGLSARQKGFVRLMGTPLGFSLLMNPDALFGVVKVFGLQDTYDPQGQTELGGAIDWMKQRGLGIYPWIDGTINLMGIYGNTFEPDLLGIRHKALLGAAVQLSRAHLGFDPAPAPYAQAMGDLRYNVSSYLHDLLPWLTEPVMPRTGKSSQEASLDTMIESVVQSANPQMTNDDLLQIMSDPDSPQYKDAYRTVADAGAVQQFLNFVIPVQFRMKHDASDVRRAQVDVVTEEAEKLGVPPWEVAPTVEDVDFYARYKAMTGSDWDPKVYEDAKFINDLVRAPVELKPFLIQENAYQHLGGPEARKHYDKYNALNNGTDPETAGLGPGARRELAYQYMDRHRGAGAAVDEVRLLNQGFLASYPQFAEFKGWQGRMYDLKEQLGGSLAEYRRQASEQNPNAARYFADQEKWIREHNPDATVEEFVALLDQSTSNANAWQAITGKGAYRSAPGPIPGVPPADVTLPNMMPAEQGGGGYNPQAEYLADLSGMGGLIRRA